MGRLLLLLLLPLDLRGTCSLCSCRFCRRRGSRVSGWVGLDRGGGCVGFFRTPRREVTPYLLLGPGALDARSGGGKGEVCASMSVSLRMRARGTVLWVTEETGAKKKGSNYKKRKKKLFAFPPVTESAGVMPLYVASSSVAAIDGNGERLRAGAYQSRAASSGGGVTSSLSSDNISNRLMRRTRSSS